MEVSANCSKTNISVHKFLQSNEEVSYDFFLLKAV